MADTAAKERPRDEFRNFILDTWGTEPAADLAVFLFDEFTALRNDLHDIALSLDYLSKSVASIANGST